MRCPVHQKIMKIKSQNCESLYLFIFPIFNFNPYTWSLLIYCSGMASTVGMAWQVLWKVTSSVAVDKSEHNHRSEILFWFQSPYFSLKIRRQSPK